MALLKRHRSGDISRSVHGVVRRAADAITNLAHENSSIKSLVRSVVLCMSPAIIPLIKETYLVSIDILKSTQG